MGSLEDNKGFGALYPQFWGARTATVMNAKTHVCIAVYIPSAVHFLYQQLTGCARRQPVGRWDDAQVSRLIDDATVLAAAAARMLMQLTYCSQLLELWLLGRARETIDW